MNKSPINNIFLLTNRDPSNYVLYKDSFVYAVISLYVFLFWYIVSVLDNWDKLSLDETGEAILYLTILVSAGLFIMLVSVLFKYEYPYSLGGIIFILLLISIGLVIFSYQTNELHTEYTKDPVRLGITFLLVYSFVSYFIC